MPSPPPLVLASTSSYRRELLGRLGIDFSTHAPQVDEDDYKKQGLAPLDLAPRLAQAKAKAVLEKHPQSCVIGSDQIAVLGDQILDKPGSAENALAQLKMLAGKSHQLITSVAILMFGQEASFTDITTLTMHPMDDAALQRYVEKENPIDCAGSYKLESLGISLFRFIESADHTAIIGLPLMQTAHALRQLGYRIP